MELRDVSKELEELKKKIDTDLLTKSDLLVLNLLPLTTEEKIMLFQQVVSDLKQNKKIECV
jgi:hypothetical protein